MTRQKNGEDTSRPASPRLRVALLGFGNVGRSFARYTLVTNESSDLHVRICAVADSSGGVFLKHEEQIESIIAHKESGGSLKEFASDDSISDPHRFIDSLAAAGITVLIESLPTNLEDGQPALDLLTRALASGISVVTVDKGPAVHGFNALESAARAGNCRFAYGGTTGVRIPDEVIGEEIIEIRGVLNGTTNYILTEMQQRDVSFVDALRMAQADGIAEPDPSLDVEGWDTVSKTLILANALMRARARLEEVSRIGIGPETEGLIRVGRETNRAVRLVGRARIYQGRVRVSVAPKLVTAESPFFSVAGTSKAAVFKTKDRREVLARARSGRDAISRAILDDIAKVIG